MKTTRIEIDLPVVIYEELKLIAEASSWPFERVLIQTIKSGMPPTLQKVPEVFHKELLALNGLEDKDLLRIAEGNWPEPEKKDAAYKKADFEVLRRTYALSLLRWRGHPVPGPYETLLK